MFMILEAFCWKLAPGLQMTFGLDAMDFPYRFLKKDDENLKNSPQLH